MAEQSLIEAMARDLWLEDAKRTIAERRAMDALAGITYAGEVDPAWYDREASMALTGPGFVAKWEGQARAALRSTLDHGPTPAMVHAGAHAVTDTPGPSALVAKRAFRLMIAAELEGCANDRA